MSDYKTFDASHDVAKRWVLTGARNFGGGIFGPGSGDVGGVIQNEFPLRGT